MKSCLKYTCVQIFLKFVRKTGSGPLLCYPSLSRKWWITWVKTLSIPSLILFENQCVALRCGQEQGSKKYTDSKLYNEKQAGIFDVVILRPFPPFIHCFTRISSITPFSHCVTYFLLLHSFSSSVKLERYVTSIESHPNRYPQDISLKETT